MNNEEKRRFFAMKKNPPHTVRIRGRFSFSNLPLDLQSNLKKRLAEKDNIMARGLAGELPGIKIDGKQVTRDNIHEFEITIKPKKEKVSKKESKILYTKKELEDLSFKELKKIGKKFGTTDRSKANLIKEILKLQKKNEKEVK